MSTDRFSVVQVYGLPASFRPVRCSRAPTTTKAPPLVSSISGRRGEPSSVLGKRSKFPCSDFQPWLPLGGELYPVRCGRWVEGAVPISDAICAQQ